MTVRTNEDKTVLPPWLSVDELEAKAREVLSVGVYDFIAGGAGDELTLAENLRGWAEHRLRPQVLTDTSSVVTDVTLFGSRLAAPVFISPMGALTAVHTEGESGLATGAREAGVGFALSTGSSNPLESVAEAAGPARWFQLYFATRDRGILQDLIDRATAADYRAILVTADVQVPAVRRRVLRHSMHGFTMGFDFANLRPYANGENTAGAGVRSSPAAEIDFGQMSVSAKEFEWVCGATDLPVMLKGVMSADDARTAVSLGAGGVVVSNHGGRQLDHAIATIDVLPEVVGAVADRVPVLVDGGVRRSTDVAIALALGARAVGLGRPVLWPLALGGGAGVAAFLTSFVEDLARTFALLGVPSVAQLEPTHVARRFRP